MEDGWDNNIKGIVIDELEDFLDSKEKKRGRLFDNAEYVKVYTMCYNMCTQKSPFNWSETLYEKHGQTLTNYLSTSVLPALKETKGEVLLQKFVLRGDNHKIMNKWHKMFFTYLDRFHVKYHQLPQLTDSGIRYFKSIIFDAVAKDVTDAIIKLINTERLKEIDIDRTLIRKCIEVYELMGMGSLETYTADFEKQFLDASREYYNEKASTWIVQDSTPAYMIKIEKAIAEESERVDN
jgi:cullin 1